MGKMNQGRSFYDYRNFVRRYAQLAKISYLVQGLLKPECEISEIGQKDLIILDKRRRYLQKRIGELNSSFLAIYANCKGACCRGSHDHFTVIDFWLRKYTTLPLTKFGIETYSPCYIRLLRDRLALARHCFPESKVRSDGCYYLGAEGCTIKVSNRPIKCLAFTCRKLRCGMDKENKRKYGKLNRHLYHVCLGAFKVLKKEAGLPSVYGNLSLILTP